MGLSSSTRGPVVAEAPFQKADKQVDSGSAAGGEETAVSECYIVNRHD